METANYSAMTRWAWIILFSGIHLMSTAAADEHHAVASFDPIAAIEEDYRTGNLTPDDRVLLVILAIKAPGELPASYRQLSLAPIGGATRCVTPVLRDIMAEWQLLSASTQQAFQAALGRFDTDYTYDTPGGFIKLHYNISPDSNGVPSDDADSNGLPDFIEKCAAYCDTTHARHLDLGYLLPVSDGILGGDEKFDVYFQDMSAYGYAMPEGMGPAPWNDYYGYIVLNNDFLGFEPNQDPEGSQWGAAKVTAAHEYHHIVQFAYDAGEDNWYMELDAVFMEEMVFDTSNDCYNYLDAFFPFPQKSLMEHSYHYYSCFIWELYLAQKFDTSLMRAAWEGAIYAPTPFEALTDSLYSRYAWTTDSAFAEFTVWNFCTSVRDDGSHHEEGANYPLVAVGISHSSYPVPFQNSPSNPAGYGCSYIQFFPGADTGTLVINFNGSDARDWSAWLIKSTAENEHEFEQIVLSPGNFQGSIEIPQFESYYRVAVAGANIMEHSSSVAYTYQAEVQPPYQLSSQLLATDSVIYSGGVRGYNYRVQNLAPLSDVVSVIVWDEQGWLPLDTIDKAMAPGLDTVFIIDVHPPQGTPLGDTATLFFSVESWGDPSVVDTQSIISTIVLQAGDLDFSGGIDISDLVYFVDYAFIDGPPPVPMLAAGDFLCDGGIDISDLVGLVDYMFNGGSPPPCNPY